MRYFWSREFVYALPEHSRPAFDVEGLPGRLWKWRLRTAGLTLAQRVSQPEFALETAAETRRNSGAALKPTRPSGWSIIFIHMALDIALETAAAQRAALVDAVPHAVPDPLKPLPFAVLGVMS